MQKDQNNSALDPQNTPQVQGSSDPVSNPNPEPTQNPAPVTPVAFSPQVDLPPLPPEFQSITDETKSAPVEAPPPVEDSGSGAPPASTFSSVASSPKKKFGTGKIIATILGIFLLVGGVGAGIILTQQQQLFQQKAASCGATCRTNCTEDETGQGQGSCPAGQISCVANSCSDVPDAGTTCVSAGFVCVARGTCPAGHNQAGSCNTANTDCCDTASGNLPSGAQPASECVFDHYAQKQVCVQVNGNWQRCDTDPKGEMGIAKSCTNSGSSGTEEGCTSEYPNCVPGPYCINPSRPCTPSVLQYANCTLDSSCTATTPPTNPPTKSPSPTPTDTPIAPYCAAITTYSSDWTLISPADRSTLAAGSTVNFCVAGGAPSGTFDMARFTINGVLQANTSTIRPSSTNICQSYTIPAGTTTFTVSAQIHHSTLGWF